MFFSVSDLLYNSHHLKALYKQSAYYKQDIVTAYLNKMQQSLRLSMNVATVERMIPLEQEETSN